MDDFDPDWKQAENHGKASKIGFKSEEKHNSTVICKCCFQYIYKEPIPLCENSKTLQILGFGFPLFYSFLRNCMLILIALICSYSAYALKTAINSNRQFCSKDSAAHRRLLAGDEKSCETFFVRFSTIEKDIGPLEQLMRIMSFSLILILLVYMRDKIIKMKEYYDERNTSLSDFSIILKKIPLKQGINQSLKNFFEKEFDKPHLIKQTTLIPDYHEMQQLFHRKKEIKNKIRKFYDSEDYENETFKGLRAEIEEVNSEIERLANESKDLNDQDRLQCQKAILVFNTEKQKDQILQNFPTIPPEVKDAYFGRRGRDIMVGQAPEPNQIIWQNINVPSSKRKLLILLGWGLSLLLLVIATTIFYFILEKKALNLIATLYEYKKHPEDKQAKANFIGAQASVYIMLFVVVLFNKLVMVTLFHKFTDLQKHNTTSKFQFSFGLKYCLGLFFTTAIMTLAVEAIRFQNYYSHPYGVIEEESIMFFLNAFFVPLFWLINPFQLIKQFKRWKNMGKRSLTQSQANSLMEDSPYEMGKRYAEIVETMWFTFLYVSLVPFGSMISLLGLICYYWVDKYNLLRRSTLKSGVSGKLAVASMNLLDLIIFFQPLGEIVFDKQLRNEYRPSSIVMLCVSTVFFLLPKNKILKFFYDEDFNPAMQTYEEIKPTLKTTYHTEHPMYKFIHNDKLKEQMLHKGMSFDEKNNRQSDTRLFVGDPVEIEII